MKLYDFQEEGVERLATSKRLFLSDDMGLGKTIQTIWAASKRLLIAEPHFLVVCPNSMKGIMQVVNPGFEIAELEYIGGWVEEIHKVDPKASIGVIEGPPSFRKFTARQDYKWFIVNYEALVGKNGDELTAILASRSWGAVIFDEHHKIKNRNAKTTKACKKLCKDAEYVWMLSGTPLMNHTSELWPPLNMMFPKDRKYSSYWRFVRAYCEVQRGVFGWEVKDILNPRDPRAIALRQDLQPLMLRRTKAEVLKDMPSKTVQQVWVELHGDQLLAYREMERDMLAHVETEVVTAAAVIAQIIRLKQITVGPELMFPAETSEGFVNSISGAKYNALVDILEADGGKKLVVFSQFRTALERIADRLYREGRLNIGELHLITGAIPQGDRSLTVKAFQEEEYPRVLFISTQAGGTGLTLTAASTAVFLDKMWTPAMNLQAQDRLHRIGQTEPVTIIELLALNSVEGRIEKTLEYKQNLFDFVIESDEALAARDEMVVKETTVLGGRQIIEALYPELVQSY